MHTTITLTRKSITVDITLHHAHYGADRFGFSYSLSHQGFWQEHGSGDVWRELSQTEAAELNEAA